MTGKHHQLDVGSAGSSSSLERNNKASRQMQINVSAKILSTQPQLHPKKKHFFPDILKNPTMNHTADELIFLMYLGSNMTHAAVRQRDVSVVSVLMLADSSSVRIRTRCHFNPVRLETHMRVS